MPLSSMPPCHTGMPCARREIVQPDRLAVAADAARLDVDDPAGAERDAPPRAARSEWIDSSRQIGVGIRALQRGVIADVVVVERLLDHHQLESVERGQVVGVAERVGGVGIDHQRDRRRNASRTRATASTSQPGLILILIRR